MEPTNNLKQAIKDYKSGNSQAFDVLYHESSKYIYTCIYKVMCGNDNTQDAINDIMQDTYVEISRYITQLEDEEKFLSWAGTIATRKCYAYLKKSSKYVLLNEEDTTLDTLADNDNIIPEEIMQDKEKQRLLREIINTELTEMQKLCIIAYYYNGQKQSEIAKELGIPENTVKTNLSRAKAKIKDGVLDLEKKKGTKLYSVAPFMLLLFREEVYAAVVPQEITRNVLSSVSASTLASGAIVSAGVEGSGVTTANAVSSGVKSAVGKAATTSIKAKVIGGLVGLGVLGAIGVGVYLMNQQPEEVNNNEIPYLQEGEAPLVDESMDDIQDDVIEEVETESEDVSEELPFEEGTWQLAYYNYLIEGNNNPDSGGYNGFDLHDFDGDGVPELVIILNNGNAGIAHFIEGQAKEVYISTDYSYLDGEHLGYGEKASQLINIWEEVDEEGRDITKYSMYDNFEYVEKVEISSIVINNVLTYIVHTDNGIQDISYDEGQAKIQSMREVYQKIDFKEMNEETIIATLETYR